MTDITELAQREKFEAWFKSSFHPDKTGPYIKDQLYFAWKAAGAELVDAVEKAQQRISELESRTVKLPDDEDGQAYGFGKWSNSKLPATAGTMTIAYCEDAWRAAFKVFSSTAGIKVEAE